MARKGYWAAIVDIDHQEGYKDYIALNRHAFEKYGAARLRTLWALFPSS